jgi:ADP-ribose pyrophosphatase YjhB (NUDIX family)
MAKHWQTLSSERIIQDRWVDLRADRCLTESGTEIAPFYVLTYEDWVHVVALTDEDEVILVEQYRHGAGIVTLELPGGVIDSTDTDPAAAAQRELLEETGFAGETWQPISVLYPNPANQTNRVHSYLATGCRRVAAPALEDGEDGLSVRCIKLTDVVSGLQSGLLGQAMHVASLLLALRMLPAEAGSRMVGETTGTSHDL